MVPSNTLELVEGPIAKLTEGLAIKHLTVIGIHLFWQIGIICQLTKETTTSCS